MGTRVKEPGQKSTRRGLAILGQPEQTAERRDAARNRQRILETIGG